MASDGQPAFDLAHVVGAAASHIIPAVPLKPAAGIFVINPALGTPVRQGLGGVYTEEIQSRIVKFMAEFCSGEPARGKFPTAIRHVLSAEDPQRQHIPGGQLRLEIQVKVISHRLRQVIDVALLHQIIHDNFSFFHVSRRKENQTRGGKVPLPLVRLMFGRCADESCFCSEKILGLLYTPNTAALVGFERTVFHFPFQAFLADGSLDFNVV